MKKYRVRQTQNHWSTARTELQDSLQNHLSSNAISVNGNGIDHPMTKNVSPVKKSSSKSVIEMRVLETNQEYKYLEDTIENINTKLIELVSLGSVVKTRMKCMSSTYFLFVTQLLHL